MNILFLCTGNSCRSIIAEALLRAQLPEGVTVQSAGSHPTGAINPGALAALRSAGVPTEGLASKSWDALTEKPDVVITLCADAEGKPCPVFFGDVIRSHWGMPDPAKVVGSEYVIAEAFAETLRTLKRRIDGLCAMLAAHKAAHHAGMLVANREAFKASLDAIAKQ